jgi:hypothetical protein
VVSADKTVDVDNMTAAEAIAEERKAEDQDLSDLDPKALEFLDRAGESIRRQVRRH